jgi:adenosylcobinamide kinase / adenosylcobinamide-phosphate guanylyltransferase
VTLFVLLGGARSGKSRLAVSLAVSGAEQVLFVATGEARDEEMAERIASHRAERPADWTTVEEPTDLQRAIAAAEAEQTVIVDCLTLWVSNLLEAGETPPQVIATARSTAAAAAGRAGLTVAVSNEVGLGVVPMTPLGRVYRDLLGEVNRLWVEAAADASLVVAGRLVPLLDVPPGWPARATAPL